MNSSPERLPGIGRTPWPPSAVPVDAEGRRVTATGLSTDLDARMTWDYSCRNERILALYEQGKRAQWNASSDVDWSLAVDWGAPVEGTAPQVRAEFERSAVGRYGAGIWDAFQWEFQSWMVSQFLHGEQGALLACARLAECLPDMEAKLYSVNQAADEARHVEVFARYLTDHVPAPYAVDDALQSLFLEVLADSRWDVVTLGIQIVLEGVALAAFQLANATFHDPLITSITKLVIRDEARHVSFGAIALGEAYRDLTAGERLERETFVLHAAELIHRRFLLSEIWERLGVKEADGVEFARTSPMMITYRQTIFAKVVSALKRIGLLGSPVVDGLDGLGLMGSVGRLAVGTSAPPT